MLPSSITRPSGTKRRRAERMSRRRPASTARLGRDAHVAERDHHISGRLGRGEGAVVSGWRPIALGAFSNPILLLWRREVLCAGSFGLIHDTAAAVAAIGENLGFWRVLPDHRSLAAMSLIAPHPGLLAMQQVGQHRAVGGIGRVAATAWISLVRLSTPRCRSTWLPFSVCGIEAFAAPPDQVPWLAHITEAR